MDALPRIGWIGELSAPTLDDAAARRAGEALRPRRTHSPTRRPAVLGLVFLSFCALRLHDPALNGSLPTRAAVARGDQSPSVESGVQEMQRMRSLMAGVVSVGVMATGAAAQQAVQWRVQDGGNGHWYELTDGSPACFESWKMVAESRGGHLATIATSSEQTFLTNLLTPNSSALIGASRPPASDAYTDWIWVTGEPYSASAILWAPDNPGCCEPNEFWLWLQGNGIHDGRQCGASEVLIEFDADCNYDGIVDYGQILSGQLADVNQNGVPDTCEVDP